MDGCHRKVFVIGVVWALVALGCRHPGSTPESPTAPTPEALATLTPPAHEFYPLAVGNSWVYQRSSRIEIEMLDRGGYKESREYEGRLERSIVGTQKISGQEYVIEKSTLALAGRPVTLTEWTRLRQDHSGLYDGPADASCSPEMIFPDLPLPLDPPFGSPVVREAWRDHARRFETIRRLIGPGIGGLVGLRGRPGGIRPGEVLRLSYPVHPKSAWISCIEPVVIRSEVETREVLDLPAGRFPAYRVRVESELLNPNDHVVVWYGRCGRVRSLVHLETVAIDTVTGEMVLMTTEEIDKLTSLSVIDRGGCGTSSGD